jgi:hypothetical protein
MVADLVTCVDEQWVWNLAKSKTHESPLLLNGTEIAELL